MALNSWDILLNPEYRRNPIYSNVSSMGPAKPTSIDPNDQFPDILMLGAVKRRLKKNNQDLGVNYD